MENKADSYDQRFPLKCLKYKDNKLLKTLVNDLVLWLFFLKKNKKNRKPSPITLTLQQKNLLKTLSLYNQRD